MTDAEQQAALYKQIYLDRPPVVSVASPPKAGKTIDSFYTLPLGLAVGLAEDLKSGVQHVGWTPHDVDTTSRTMDDLIASIEKRVKRGPKGLTFTSLLNGKPLWGLIVDDYSRKAKAQLEVLEPKIPRNADGKKNAFWIWGEIQKRHSRIITMTSELGVPVYFSCHPKPPDIDPETKEPQLGCHDVGSRGTGLTMAKEVHVVAYAELDGIRGMIGNRWGWGLHVSTRGGKWVAGDRHGVLADGSPGYPATSPFNMAEALRMGGYSIPRPFEWGEGVVIQGVDMLLAGRPPEVVVREAAGYMQKNNAEAWQIIWVLRDIMDRYEFRTKSRRMNPLLAWGL